MDETIFDERKADKALIESLMHTTQLLWRELEEKRGMVKSLEKQIKQGSVMKNQIMKDLNGVYHLVKEYEPLTKEIAEKIIAEGKHVAETVSHDIQMAEQFLQAEAAKASGQADTTTTAEQTTSTPAEQTQGAPVEQSQTQPTDQGQVPPADPSQQVPAPTLTADPNPQAAASATDPNQVQTQPDPNAAPQLQ